MERSFGAMLRQLPGKTEVPNLLVDISQTGLAAGLQEKLFQPGSEKSNGFYAELPIKIKLVGSYHDFGKFVSGIAALPRIVTLHDIQISPVDAKGGYDNLTMDVTAKTYRYIEDEGGAQTGAKKEGGRRDVKTYIGRIGVIGVVLAALLAAGCSGGQSDLQKWIEATKKKPGGRIQPLPEVKPYETYVYAAAQPALAVPTAGSEFGQRPGKSAAELAPQPRIPGRLFARHSEDGRHFQGGQQFLWARAIQRRPRAQGSARQLSRAERRQSDGNYRRKN